MPLRLRLAALFSLATAVIIAGAAVVFLGQLRAGLYTTLDTGLRTQLGATAQELASDGQLPPFRPNDDPTVVENLDGTTVQASPSAAGLRISVEQRTAAVRDTAFFTTDVGGTRTRVLASTAPLNGRPVLVMVGTGTDVSDDALERVRAALIVGGPIGVLLVGVGAWLLADAALRPVERMRREANAIGEHDPDRRLAIPGTRDEIAALGATMNRLLDRLHTALERERRFVGDASHELRTPLAILRTELELANRPGRSRDHQPPIELDCPSDLRFVVDPDRLLQVVENLVGNAVVHTPPRTRVQVIATRDEDGNLMIRVLDEGTGLPPEFRPRAFDRFHRAEDARSRETGGTGLGLSIVRAIAEAHGGTADIDNRPQGGACATVILPDRVCSAPGDR